MRSAHAQRRPPRGEPGTGSSTQHPGRGQAARRGPRRRESCVHGRGPGRGSPPHPRAGLLRRTRHHRGVVASGPRRQRRPRHGVPDRAPRRPERHRGPGGQRAWRLSTTTVQRVVAMGRGSPAASPCPPRPRRACLARTAGRRWAGAAPAALRFAAGRTGSDVTCVCVCVHASGGAARHGRRSRPQLVHWSPDPFRRPNPAFRAKAVRRRTHAHTHSCARAPPGYGRARRRGGLPRAAYARRPEVAPWRGCRGAPGRRSPRRARAPCHLVALSHDARLRGASRARRRAAARHRAFRGRRARRSGRPWRPRRARCGGTAPPCGRSAAMEEPESVTRRAWVGWEAPPPPRAAQRRWDRRRRPRWTRPAALPGERHLARDTTFVLNLGSAPAPCQTRASSCATWGWATRRPAPAVRRARPRRGPARPRCWRSGQCLWPRRGATALAAAISPGRVAAPAGAGAAAQLDPGRWPRGPRATPLRLARRPVSSAETTSTRLRRRRRGRGGRRRPVTLGPATYRYPRAARPQRPPRTPLARRAVAALHAAVAAGTMRRHRPGPRPGRRHRLPAGVSIGLGLAAVAAAGDGGALAAFEAARPLATSPPRRAPARTSRRRRPVALVDPVSHLAGLGRACAPGRLRRAPRAEAWGKT